MRIYINRTTGQFITSPKFNAIINRFDWKRGDTAQVEIGFVDDGVLVPLVGAFGLTFGMKEDGKFEGDYVVQHTDFTLNATTGFYVGTPNFNTIELDALLMVDGDDSNDIEFVDLLFEVSANDDNGIFSSSTSVARVFHDVIKGDEGVPTTGTPTYPTAQQLIDLVDLNWVELPEDTHNNAALPSVYTLGKLYLMATDAGTGYPEEAGSLWTDTRLTSGVIHQQFISVVDILTTPVIYNRTGLVTADIWNPWKKTITSEDGEILDQIQLPNQLATDDDSALTKGLGDGLYAGVVAIEIIVTQASDLSGTLDSTKSYKLDGIIAMGSQTITVPSGGLTIVGRGNNITGLTTSQASHTLFVDAASDAGSLTIAEMDIKVDGASSKVFDLDKSGAGGIVRIVNCSFTDCTEIGEFDAYFAALCSDMVWFNADQGMTFSGTWGGGINTNGFVPLNLGSTGTAFKEGTALVLGSRFISNANMDLQAGAIGFNFTESNFTHDGDFELLSGSYSGAGTVVTGITRGNTKCKWRDNNGLGNTYVGSRWALTTEIATSIGSSNTYVKMAGTTTYADEQWFSNTTDNAFVFDSTNPIEAIIAGTMSVSAGNNNQLQIKVRQWDDSASAYIDIHEHGPITMSGAGAGENISILGYADLDTNDRIEVWVQNLTAATNITMLEGTLISISERAN